MEIPHTLAVLIHLFSVEFPGEVEVRGTIQIDRLVDVGCCLNDTDCTFSLHLSNNMLTQYPYNCYPHDPTVLLKYIAMKIRSQARLFSIEVNDTLGTTHLHANNTQFVMTPKTLGRVSSLAAVASGRYE